MDLKKTSNGTGDTEDEYTNIYFIVGDRRETASFRADQVTNKELKGREKLLISIILIFLYYY